jgi:F-type H+-transporting ATPase subunit delta
LEEIAEVYARSLFEVAQESDKLDEIHEELGQFADALSDSRELQMFLFSPYFSSEEKKDGIGKIIEGGNENFVRFLELLAERHRVPALFRIRREFDRKWADAHKLLSVTITSAVELDDDIQKDLREKIEQATGRTVEFDAKVDPDVLGGLVLQVGNFVMDASVRSRLEKLRKQVARAA